jgi:twinfilin-like protein
LYTKSSGISFQNDLNLLDNTLDPKIPLYLLLRRGDSVSAITFVPFRAPVDESELYLHHRHDLVASLGAEHFKMSLVCKEIGEITDARSWVERDVLKDETEAEEKSCENSHDHDSKITDIGYKKNQCRLCDRRMKNKITDEALAALGKLRNEGNCVQIVSCFFGKHVLKTTNETVTELRPGSDSRSTGFIASS